MNQQNQPWVRSDHKPSAHVTYAHGLGRGMLVAEQIQELIKAINPAYVETKQRLTYLSQHQARAEMNRIFGYGNWDSQVDEMQLMYENTQVSTKDNKERWVVGYRARVVVNIRDLWGMPVATFSEWHAEENAPQPNRGEAHALALTSVESYALRRALIGLGDRFGLGLYDGGSTAPHGQYSIQLQPGVLYDWTQGAPAQPSHETIQAEPAAPEAAGDEEPAPAAPAPTAPARSPQMEKFHEAREKLQADRDEDRMLRRMQQGLKLDERGGE